MMKNPSADAHALPSLVIVLGYIAIKELGRLEDRVRILSRLGYGVVPIAQICGSSVAAVREAKKGESANGA